MGWREVRAADEEAVDSRSSTQLAASPSSTVPVVQLGHDYAASSLAWRSSEVTGQGHLVGVDVVEEDGVVPERGQAAVQGPAERHHARRERQPPVVVLRHAHPGAAERGKTEGGVVMPPSSRRNRACSCGWCGYTAVSAASSCHVA